MAFYKARPSNMQCDTGSCPESSHFMSTSSEMVSPFTQFSSTSSFATLSFELSIITNLVVAGLSILSIVSLLLVIILA